MKWLMAFLLSGILLRAEEMTVVEYEVRQSGETSRVTITSSPANIRVDLPAEKFSLIYERSTQKFIGLEHRDYHYWQFLLMDVLKAAHNSDNHARRLRDLNIEGMASVDLLREDPKPVVPEAPHYLWKQESDKRKWGAYACTLWTGIENEKEIRAWCTDSVVGSLAECLRDVDKISEPMALIALRPLFPKLVSPVTDSMIKASVTPIRVEWGDPHDTNYALLLSIKTQELKSDRFRVPESYLPTTLAALDGITTEVK